jgi:hypothetical protein
MMWINGGNITRTVILAKFLTRLVHIGPGCSSSMGLLMELGEI